MTGIDPDRIRAEARAATGQDDNESAMFDRNLDVLADSLNREGNLSPGGAAQTHGECVAALTNRLESLRWTREHPEILQERIERPILLTGLPRSGTTFFQQLFNRDPALRAPLVWETTAPCPPPAAVPESVPSRVAAAHAETQAIREQIKEFDSIHLRDPEGPEECHNFLAQSFAAIGFHNYMNVPSYAAYLFAELDLEAAYRVHRRQLQLLQWRAPARRWVVKYPNHLIAMGEIMRVYPDASFVMTHRDPVQTLASLCRLTDTFRAARMVRVNHDEVGPQMLDFVSRHLDRLMRFIDEPANRSHVVNVDYYRLIADPATELETVYTALGMTMPDAVRQDVRAWHASNPKGKRGENRYALADFGLDEDAVAERFGDYMRRFAIPREADGLRVAA